MDPTTLRQCHDLVENLDRYVHHHPEDRPHGIWLIQLGPVTFFVIDGTGERMCITRVNGDEGKVHATFEKRVEDWQNEHDADANPCIINMAAETLLWLRDHPGTIDTVKVWAAGKMNLSNISRAIKLGKLMRRALGWRP